MKRVLRIAAIALVVLLLGAQAVPYGRDTKNPPVVEEPAWDSEETRALARRACFDCHSNETTWPWYSHVAPISWLVYRDVEHAREHLNFSECNKEWKDADEAAEEVTEGEMPLQGYLLLHPEARLSPAERKALADGLDRSLRTEEWE
jgi:hypothetical protein